MAANRKARFKLFLNPYESMAFTRCPQCDAKTRQRKLPLVIHIEPHTMVVLNKTCRFCPTCELVIVRQSQLDPLLTATAPSEESQIIHGDYVLVGTLDRKDWREGDKGLLAPADVVDRVWLFEKQWFFEIRRGWTLAGDGTT